LNLGETFRQLTQRIKQALRIKNEGCERSQPHRTGRHHPATKGQHHRYSPKGHPLDEGGDAAVEKDRAIHGTAISHPCGAEALAIHRFAAEHLHHLEALEVLLKISIELRQLFSHAVVGLAIPALQPKDHQRDRNLGRQQQQTEPPLHQQHRCRDHHQAHQIAQHTHRTAAKHLCQGIHIAGEPRQQLANGHAVVKPHRQAHCMGEEVLTDAGGQALSNRLDIEGLHPLQGQTQQH